MGSEQLARRPSQLVFLLLLRSCKGMIVHAFLSVIVVALMSPATTAQPGKLRPAFTLPKTLDPSTCPPTYDEPILLLISTDGFSAEYLDRGLSPNIEALIRSGVSAPYMKATYPTATFPNHYTIATGLYPSSHGIIANGFWDPVLKAKFRFSKDPKFWGGEPIWKTIERQGKITATYFWPGSEVEGIRSTYWKPYNESTPFEVRANQTLEWILLPKESRPSFVTLYLEAPDTAGHDFGPNSPEVERSITEADTILGNLLKRLMDLRILPCINLLVVADHGMADAGQQRAIYLDEYIPNIENSTRFFDGIFGRIEPNDGNPATTLQIARTLACRRREMRVYLKEVMPVRWHLNNQRRVESLVLDLNAGYSVGADRTFKADNGDHGYDNYFASMNALFLGFGPAFKSGVEVETFQNIELYNLMCLLTGVRPAPNNGTVGALNHLLKNPPPSPVLPPLFDLNLYWLRSGEFSQFRGVLMCSNLHPSTQEYVPPLTRLPQEDELEDLLESSNCYGDDDDDLSWTKPLSLAETNSLAFASAHMPWGAPQLGSLDRSTVSLAHLDHMTFFSRDLKLPLLTSFTLLESPQGSYPAKWMSDVRLDELSTPKCTDYVDVAPLDVSRVPLFNPLFSAHSKDARLPFLISNAVPMTGQLQKRWTELLHMVKGWHAQYGSLNVIMGPVFDFDGDNFADDLRQFRKHNLVVPTHMFMVVTRCAEYVSRPINCPVYSLDSMAFIYPQYTPVTNCQSAAEYAREYSAKVLDVEKIAGIRLFPHLSYKDQTRLKIRIHSNLWGSESWANRIRTDWFGLKK
ncbi:venom phosphodiesterase-like [Oratosquilla oratoria]|uniref:venom phosphodiesterase-like n=1 Tax=Oratosquilla oratoria TaxID=337810 RepID=UPI003F773728